LFNNDLHISIRVAGIRATGSDGCPDVEGRDMRQIVFEFMGGCMDGRKIEGGGGRSLSTANRDPVLGHWFGTNFGTPGRQFYMQAGDDTSPQDHLYEVMERIDGDDLVVVQAKHVSEPRG
jgi:hypothetical protein